MEKFPEKIKAAVLFKNNTPLKLVNLDVPTLNPGQVLVKILYSGICRSQIMEIKGQRGEDKWLPHMLGHEAVGKVIRIGPKVKKVKESSMVILSWIKGKGLNVNGARYKYKNNYINSGPITTFSNYSIISENRLFLKPKNIDTKIAVLCGCALPTGYGIVNKDLDIKKNDKRSILLYGIGGIGSSSLLALKEKKIKNLLILDNSFKKIKFAKDLGYENIFNSNDKNYKKKILELTNGGADLCIESAGKIKTIEDAFSLINPKNGHLIFASHPPNKEYIKIFPHQLISGKKITGTWGGSANLDIDLKKLSKNISFMKSTYEKITKKIYSLENINKAIKDLENGNIFRAIIKMSHS
jgi:S-(hydroxymethyl)glutathione dehydrogenase/alcohol dehydrogenase